MSREIALQMAQDNWIKRWQIENALQAQLIYKSPLVANLIKLGYLSEENALRFISNNTQVPIVDDKLLESIPQRIVDLVPKDMIRYWRIVPVGVKDSHLMVAISLPPAENLIEDMAFFFGMKVRLLLCKEAALLKAVRRHYAMILPSLITREKLSEEFFEPPPSSGTDPGVAPDAMIADSDVPSQTGRDGQRVTAQWEALQPEDADPAATQGFGPDESAVQNTADEPPISEPIEPADVAEEIDLAIDGADLFDDFVPQQADAGAEAKAKPEEQETQAEQEEPDDATALSSVRITLLQESLANADSRDEILQAACEWLAASYRVRLFLTIKRSQATGFFLQGTKADEDVDIKQLELSLNLVSACQKAVSENISVAIGGESDAAIDHIAQFLRRKPPLAAVILPVQLKGRPIGMVIGLDRREEVSQEPDATWQQVRAVISSAFETLILSKKIGV